MPFNKGGGGIDQLTGDVTAGPGTGSQSTSLVGTTNVDSVIAGYYNAAAVTLTNKRITKRVVAFATNAATYSVDTDNYDVVHITAQTATITSIATTGTPVDGDTLRISITGTAAVPFTLASANFEASTVALSTTTTGTARLDMGFFWNSETGKWRQVAAA